MRGILRRGSSAVAVVGVGEDEAQSAVDGIISTAVLWMEHCRERYADRMHVAGTRLFVPRGRAEVVRLRLAHLNHALAKWELQEFDERTETLEELDPRDAGNLATRLVQAPDRERARRASRRRLRRSRQILPQAEIEVVSAAEVSLRYHGLELARAAMREVAGSFRNEPVLLFPDTEAPAAGSEIAVDSEPSLNSAISSGRLRRCGTARTAIIRCIAAARSDGWRQASGEISARSTRRLDPAVVYAQVPAFAASDRAMIDLLGVTREGRLAVIELKAEEDMHLPLQGLDYWARVRWHQQRGEFQRFGYFPGRELSPEPPLLLMAAPSLHVHPTTDCLLRHYSADIEWELLGLDEHWRRGVRVIFRKTRESQATSDFRFLIANDVGDACPMPANPFLPV